VLIEGTVEVIAPDAPVADAFAHRTGRLLMGDGTWLV
jgi:hypothetical protein